ncbi:YceI family protein [Corynebacterium aurimucosum]
MKSLLGNRKLIVSIFAILIVASTALALGPLVFSLIMGRGVKTEPINPDKVHAATTDVNGEWHVAQGTAYNHTSAGFTIDEILPADKRTTSGSTKHVTGQATIKDGTVEEARIAVDMASLTTDKKVRDQNMKTKLFEVTKYPESTFTLTEPADVSAVPDDGSVVTVPLTGDLTIHGETKSVSQDFQVVRDGDTIILGGDIPISRLDFGIETPEMIAARISETGEINVRVTFEK